MPSFAFSRLERLYVQTQSVFGVIPNSSGTASVSGTDATCLIRATLENSVALLPVPCKTGTRSAVAMIGGRKTGTWSVELALIANGTIAVLPDADPLFQGIFGQTAAVTASSTVAITSSTDATPIVLTTSAHGVSTSSLVPISIAGHLTNINANGVYYAEATGTTSMTLLGSRATGAGVGSGGALNLGHLSYTFVDEIAMLSIWSFRLPSTLDQRVAHTCVVSEAMFNLGSDIATWTVNGECVWALSSKFFASADSYQRAGLTAFPSEPGSPATTGNAIPGFTGRFVVGTAASFVSTAKDYPTVRNVSIRVQTQNAIVKDTFGSYYGTTVEGGERNVTLSFSIYDDDSTEVQNLKVYGDAKTKLNVVVNVGTEPGSAFMFILRNVYLASHVLGDGQLRFDATFNENRATATSVAVRDEMELVIA